MNSEEYLSWCDVPNTVNSRLKNNSLVHTFTREKIIRKSTKLINESFNKKHCANTLEKFRQCKQKILEQLTKNDDVIGNSDFSDNYFKSYYDSFDTTISNLYKEDFLWNYVDKKGRHQNELEDSELFQIWEPNTNISILKTADDFENLCNVSKIRKQTQTIPIKNSNKEKVTPKSLIKTKSAAKNSTTFSSNKVSSIKSKLTLRKNISEKEKQNPKTKQISNNKFKDVRKNLTSALDNVSLKSQEFDGDEWNDDFIVTEFQAQSTQIFSDTFSEKNPKSGPNIGHKLSHEIINQPRDSGIEEDSREDNAKFENPDDKKCNENGKKEENDESETFKEENLDNIKDPDNNLHQNEVKKSPYKKVPLKIIGEEKITKKFKIITNKDKELKPVEEKKKEELLKPESNSSDKVSPVNEKLESSSESDSEFADCHNANDSLCNKSDKDSSDEYYELQDDHKRGDSDDNQNKLNNEDLQNDGREGDSEGSENEHENEKVESDNSSTNESIIRKRKLKQALKKCTSPFMILRYNALKKSRVLEESDIESEIKLRKNSEKKSKRTLTTPSKSSKTKKTSQLEAASLQDIPKTQKQVNNDESFEEETLVAENFNDNSVLISGLKENVDIEDDIEEATPKRLNGKTDNDESENSEIENIHEKVNAETKGKKSSVTSNNKKVQQQMKRLDRLNSCEDSNKSENESNENEANEISLNSNTSSKKLEKTASSKIENIPHMSKSKKENSDSIVSETTSSESSSEFKQFSKKNNKIKVPKKLLDKDTSSAREESVEISTQNDLNNVVKNYKQTLLPHTPGDLNESNEPADIVNTQFQSIESPAHEDSDDSENSEAEKTVINVKKQNEEQEMKRNSDSKKKDDSLKNKSPTVNEMKQKTKALKESSSEEDISDSEELNGDTFNANVNKNEASEDECIMSSKSKENLNKIKRLDLLNSDEDSDDSKDDITEKNHCNSDVDIEEHKIEAVVSCDDSKKKVSLNKLKSSDIDSSDKSESENELHSVCKTNKLKSKHLSSKFNSFKDSEEQSGAVPDVNDNNSNSSNKSVHKRKFSQIDSADVNDMESGTSQEIDVVHYSSENEINDQRKIKKLKNSNFGSSTLAEEENIDTMSTNPLKPIKLDTVSSENESDDDDSDQAMSYSSKQKILRLKKMNLLANDSSSSSEDEKIIENSQNKTKKDRKKVAENKSSALNDSDSDSDSNSDSEKKKDVHGFNAKINKSQYQVKENKELDEKDDKSDVEDHITKDDITDENSKIEDSEEECTMSSQTKERLNKMKRLDLLNSDEDSDDSKDSNEDKNFCNSNIDIEDVITKHNVKKNIEPLKNQMNSSESNSEKSDSAKSEAKSKNSIKEKLISENAKKNEISKKSSKLTSALDPTDSTEVVDNAIEKEENKSKESKKSKKKIIIQETQESVHSQDNILESQPMFSSLEDLRQGIDENQLNFEVESDVNANSLKDASHISSTQAPLKIFTDKITKISELVEKESLEKITCQSTMSIKDISADEDIFVFEVPKTIFNENLVGKKFSFSKTTLTVGNSKYEAFQKKVSPTYSCILKTEKKALDSFTTQNIRPVARIIARRKKFVDESTKESDNEIDKNIHESSSDNDTKSLDSVNNSLKNKITKTKVIKKAAKKARKSEEKELLDSSVTLNKESKKAKSKKNKFNVENAVEKTTKEVSSTDNTEKRRKTLHRKVQTLTDDASNNDETAKSESVDNNTLSCFSEETHAQTKEKKTPIKEAVHTTSSKDKISKKIAKSPGKLKKVKPAKDVEETEEFKVTDKKKNTEPMKKMAKSESKPTTKKRKAESQPSEDANPEEKQETSKKKKPTTEKKEKKPTSKTTKPRNSKKKAVNESGESAADQIRKLIAKNIKFDDSLNSSFDRANYNPLDIKRVSKKHKRCQSTTSSSSDDDSKFTRSSFHVRVKKKSEGDKSADTSSDVKSEDKKSVKKIFFAE